MRISNARGNPSSRSSHGDVRWVVSSQFSNDKLTWVYRQSVATRSLARRTRARRLSAQNVA